MIWYQQLVNTGMSFLQNSRGVNPLRSVDFMSFEKHEFAQMMLSEFPHFSTEQLLETSES